MKHFTVSPIGNIEVSEQGVHIKLAEAYRVGLKELDGFSHLTVIWWFDENDHEQARGTLETPAPYRLAPQSMGVFATRSPFRPNPIALTTVQIIDIDQENGVILISHIDAHDNSPVLDLKPYTPSLDRVEQPIVPAWCAHWPKSLEDSARFDWEKEFNF